MALVTEEEIASALGKQGVTDIRRISIRKGKEQIQTNTYILTFNLPHTSKEVKISYCLERVEQYIPVSLRCFKCQKYGHHKKACRGRQTCAKCGEKDLDYMEEDCLKEIRCANCRQDHLVYTRSCDVYKKLKGNTWEETQEKYVLLEARKIVGTYMGENSYTSVAWRGGGYNQSKQQIQNTCGEIDPVGSKWLAKVSGASEKTTLSRILPSTSSATG